MDKQKDLTEDENIKIFSNITEGRKLFEIAKELSKGERCKNIQKL